MVTLVDESKNNFLRALLDTGSDGDLMFEKKRTTKCFLDASWHLFFATNIIKLSSLIGLWGKM